MTCLFYALLLLPSFLAGAIGLTYLIACYVIPALSMPGSRRKTPKSPPRDQP